MGGVFNGDVQKGLRLVSDIFVQYFLGKVLIADESWVIFKS